MLRATTLLLSCLLFLSACVSQSTLPNFNSEEHSIHEAQQLFERYYQYQQRTQHTQWPNITSEANQRALSFYQNLQQSLSALADQQLDFITYLDKQTLSKQLQFEILQLENFSYTLFDPQTNQWPTRAIRQLVLEHSVSTIADAQDYLQRLDSLASLLQQWQQHYQASSLAYPAQLTQALLQELGDYQVDSLNNSILWLDFSAKVQKLEVYTNTQQLLLNKARTTLQRKVIPAYQQLQRQIAASNPKNISYLSQANGQNWYHQRLNLLAGEELGALQIHQLALEEVQQLQQQLSTATQAEPPVAEWSITDIVTKANQHASPQLTYMPQTPLVLQATHYRKASKQLLPYYVASDPESRYPARFLFQNTKQLTATAYADYNSLPMLHAQIALIQEQALRPNFIRFSHLASENQSWSLYSQQLTNADEYLLLGNRLKQLQVASQVVVDTGMHALGWTVQQSLNYLDSHTPFANDQQLQITTQALQQPGQSSATFLQLRQLINLAQVAQKHQGRYFSLAKFHSDYLAQGSLFTQDYAQWLDYWLRR